LPKVAALNHNVPTIRPMSAARSIPSQADQAGSTAVREDMSQPVPRPRHGFWNLLRAVLRDGGPGYLQFAITNACNARCDFCGFAVDRFDPRQRRNVTLAEARNVVDICLRNHIGYLLFVGGEPMVHPDLRSMIRYAARQGIHPLLCTNGSLFTESRVRNLAADGLTSVIISIDTHHVRGHEQHRGLPEVCARIRAANQLFRTLGIQSTASVTISRLIEDLDALPGFLQELGFSSCTFSYPLTTLGSSYLSFSDSRLVDYAPEELVARFEQIKALKRRHPFPIVNPHESLSEMQRHLRGDPERFGCLGGHKYFYLDWNLNLYRCHYWEQPMCSIHEFDSTKLVRDNCTRCMIDCYRDPSVLQRIAINASEAWNHLKHGRLHRAAARIFDRRNLASLRAAWEDRQWITRV
jgi:MoaA/NifB/PqqE/SkfB family radical SAM enzyme